MQKIAAASGEKDDGRILRVAAYCRVSTDDIDQVISIELQKNNYRDMIRANPKWKYAGTYVEMLTTSLIPMHPTCTQIAP